MSITSVKCIGKTRGLRDRRIGGVDYGLNIHARAAIAGDQQSADNREEPRTEV